jgi:RNA polymerase sigma-70 factor (ECF subfamily)
MAVNSSIYYIRRQSTHRDKLEKMEPETTVSMPDNLSFYSLIDKLDDDHKAVLLLSEIGGFKYEEIAEILQTKTGTVKSRASRAIVKLREILAKEVIR